MANTSIQISLPEPTMAHVQAVVRSGDFASADDYFAFLVQSQVDAEGTLEQQLLASMEEEYIEVKEEDFSSGNVIQSLRHRIPPGK